MIADLDNSFHAFQEVSGGLQDTFSHAICNIEAANSSSMIDDFKASANADIFLVPRCSTTLTFRLRNLSFVITKEDILKQ
jgi:hypothetical protein